MKILVLNTGSSSLKYEIFSMPEKKSIIKGIVENIKDKNPKLTYEYTNNTYTLILKENTYDKILQNIFFQLTQGKNKILENIEEIQAVGHRVVHGGEKFTKSTLITSKVKQKIQVISELAPLHNPANLIGIHACEKILPHIPQIAVFDTAFHQSMKEDYFLYPIPYKYYKKYAIRKYGFQGTSHNYVSQRACKILKKDFDQQRIISCHLGSGASICAIKDGKVIDTSMGFTPLAGIMMGTRSGDIDTAILPYLQSKEKLSSSEVLDIFNTKSGLLGISETTADMRDILSGKDRQSKLALNIYINKIIHYIGAYIAILGGINILIFTAGIGEKSTEIRKLILDRLSYLGVQYDKEKNQHNNAEILLSTPQSPIKVLVIPTKEELIIAQETYKIIFGNRMS